MVSTLVANFLHTTPSINHCEVFRLCRYKCPHLYSHVTKTATSVTTIAASVHTQQLHTKSPVQHKGRTHMMLDSMDSNYTD